MPQIDRDEELSHLLETLHQQEDDTGTIQPDKLRPVHPTLVDEAVELLELEHIVKHAANDWRRLVPAETASMFAGSAETGVETCAEAKTTEDEEEPLPESLGRYKVTRRLGRGGMGSVYEALDPQLNRKVAIKVPNFPGPMDKQLRARQRFVRESRAAAIIEHPNVCQIYDAGEDSGRPYVVMAYVPGESLSDRLKSGRYADPREAALLIAQSADALAAVHSHGIIHRDIKPGNILLQKEEPKKQRDGTTASLERGSAIIPKLTDFGLARREEDVEQLTTDGTLIGTPAYMSPEQASPDFGPVTQRSDIYSLGTVLYEMLSGRRPYEGSVTQILAQVCSKPLAPLSEVRPDIDPALAAIVTRATARDPQQRYADAAEFAAELRRWLGGQIPLPKPAVADRPVEVVATQKKTPWVLLAVVGGLAAMLVLGVGVVVLGLAGALTLWTSDVSTPVNPEAVANGTPVAATNNSDSGKPLPPQKGDITIVVYRNPKQEADGSLTISGAPLNLRDPGVLPLQPGKDALKIEAKLRDRPAYMYIVWLNTEGKIEPIFPWDENWTRIPEWDKPRKTLDFPGDVTPGKNVARLGGGPRGIESLIMLVRDEPLPPNEDIRTFFNGLTPQDGLELGSAVWLENGQVVTREGPDRSAVKVSEAAAINDPVLKTQRILREKLGRLFPYSRAVCFSNIGDK